MQSCRTVGVPVSWPQITIIALYCVEVGYQIAKHGKPRKGENNGLYAALVVAALMWVLYMGGFFA